MSEELGMTPGMALAFFASVIKSGEPWTDDCQKSYDEAQAAIAAWNRRASPTTEGRGMDIATKITGPCSCHEAYKSRGLIAPDCAFHDMAREIAEALEETRCEALEKAARVAEAFAARAHEALREATEHTRQSCVNRHSSGIAIASHIRALSPAVKD